MHGDVDGLTVYTNKNGRIIAYPVTPPTSAPTPAQTRQRRRFKLAQSLWSGLSPADRRAWETCVKHNSLCMTGQNLFIALALNPDNPLLAGLNLKAGTTITPPQPLPL